LEMKPRSCARSASRPTSLPEEPDWTNNCLAVAKTASLFEGVDWIVLSVRGVRRVLPPSLTRCFGVTEPASAFLKRVALGVLNSKGVEKSSEIGGTFSLFSSEGGPYWSRTVCFVETIRAGFGESRIVCSASCCLSLVTCVLSSWMCSAALRVRRFRAGSWVATSASGQMNVPSRGRSKAVPSRSMVLRERFPSTVEAIVLAAFEVVSWRCCPP
jgi:hypothetical protein